MYRLVVKKRFVFFSYYCSNVIPGVITENIGLNYFILFQRKYDQSGGITNSDGRSVSRYNC